MKKTIKCLCACLIVVISTSSFRPASAADETGIENNDVRIENFISGIYSQIDFSKCNHLSYEVFKKAYHGYLNLRNEGKIDPSKEIISICDFELPSNENRLWIIDLHEKKVLFNTYVAHGQGSGEQFASAFSNSNNSHQSSLGFYVTGATYDGEHGTSLRLYGMDENFNDAAYDRGIVVHAAAYVSDEFINGNNNKLGRSWGCPAVSPKLSLPIINTIKDSTCLFIYYPEANYLKSAYWLNKKIASLPVALPAGMMCDNTPAQKANP
jgi:hypothetical protein